MKPKILNWSDCEWMVARKGIQGKRFHGETMSLQIGEITKGNEVLPHKHNYEQIALILGGECDFYVDGVPYALSEGCVMSIPPNAEHYIVATSQEPVINLDIFYPKRDGEDSIPKKPFFE